MRASGLLGVCFGGSFGRWRAGAGQSTGAGVGWSGLVVEWAVKIRSALALPLEGAPGLLTTYCLILGAAPGGLLEDPTPPGRCSQHEWAVLDGARVPYL